ncbi:MAG TPA: VWA domain-containing protein [Caulobacteraceae bacterium]|nr:VWA domain-containing protein [Caulobacteraceae bacterium]
MLDDFIRALRACEVRVSPAEAIDAHRAWVEVGFGDRMLVRDALAITLAKSAEETARFEACFDAFFARSEFSSAGPAEKPAGVGLEAMIEAGDTPGLAVAMESAAVRAGAGAVQIATQRGLIVRRMLDEMGLRALEARISALNESQSADDRARAERLGRARTELFDQANAFVDRQIRLYAGETGRRLRNQILARQSFTSIADEDIRAMEALVRSMAKRLAQRYARRRHRAKVGKLDVRHTVRRSLAYDGAPFELVWKRKTIEKPQIVVVCDVSRSVAAAAQFLLLFLYCLKEVVQRLDSFAFSDRLVPVNDLLDDEKVDDAITLILDRVGFRPTDYGRALADLFERHGARLDRHTTVIILGDGRSNYVEPRLDLMRRLSEQTRSIVWLNPEPQAYWGQGDSRMDAYARFCRVAKTCNTLEGLERIIEDVLRTHLPR